MAITKWHRRCTKEYDRKKIKQKKTPEIKWYKRKRWKENGKKKTTKRKWYKRIRQNENDTKEKRRKGNETKENGEKEVI